MFEDLENDYFNDFHESDNDDDKHGAEKDLRASDDNENLPNDEKPLTKVEATSKKPRSERIPKGITIERLTGERGLASLDKMFSDHKIRGRGHEFADLNSMMSMIEYWAHRMAPDVAFDDALMLIERLGGKRPVQMCLSSFRTSEEANKKDEAAAVVVNDDDDDDDDNDDGNDGNDDNEKTERNDNTAGVVDTWDDIPMERHNEPQSQLTQEQLDRIELNKRRAAEIRERKLQQVRLSSSWEESEDSFAL